MKPLAHDMSFPAIEVEIGRWQEQITESGILPTELMEEAEGLDVNRWYILYLLNNGQIKRRVAVSGRNVYSNRAKRLQRSSFGGRTRRKAALKP